ncbi:MAG: gephyrin-like molybdotransferase Glp [Candidatus Bathyarchaeia archaeon]
MIGRRKMEGFPSLMTADEALRVLKEHLRPRVLEAESVELTAALGRTVTADVVAPFNVPPFDRSAVEGYAVIASDTTSASVTNPVELSICGRSEAGSTPNSLPPVKRGEAVVILTGGPMPPGADAVVMVEHTKQMEERVFIHRPVGPFQNVSRRGEDFAEGETVLRRGTRIRPWHIGAVASLNLVRFAVQRKLRVALISTGSEVKEPGSEIKPGEIINSSKPMLTALLVDYGCEPLNLGTIPDDAASIRQAIERALDQADIVITTGGTSLGEKDLVPEILNGLGKPGVVVHGVAIRPAKPTGFAIINEKPVFMLSGYPVAALLGYQLFVEPAIDTMRGSHRAPEAKVRARLTRKVATPVGVRSFVRVRLTRKEREYYAEPLRLTGSGILSSMTKANGILVVPERTEGYDEGAEVEVTVIQPLEEAV